MFFELVKLELANSRREHGNIRSEHEAFGIMDEEWQEVRDEIHKKELDKKELLKELVQLAAMCAKTAEDLGLMQEPPAERDIVTDGVCS